MQPLQPPPSPMHPFPAKMQPLASCPNTAPCTTTPATPPPPSPSPPSEPHGACARAGTEVAGGRFRPGDYRGRFPGGAASRAVLLPLLPAARGHGGPGRGRGAAEAGPAAVVPAEGAGRGGSPEAGAGAAPEGGAGLLRQLAGAAGGAGLGLAPSCCETERASEKPRTFTSK